MDAAIVDVSTWPIGGPEHLGSSEKLWLVDEHEVRWLWKAASFNHDHKVGTFRKGDDWAEWLGTQIAVSLGLPAAPVQLAQRDGQCGTIGRSFLERDQQLVLGNVLLSEIDAGYPREERGSLTEYTAQAVMNVLGPAGPPVELDGGEWTAPQVMTGYLMLDALIANRDRHHENWGVVIDSDPSGSRRLAPTFDHGSSLGFLLSDEDRQSRLVSPDKNRTPEKWAQRARSPFDRQRPAAVFFSAAGLEQQAANEWLARLEAISIDDLRVILDAVPTDRMSSPSREFAIRVLEENRKELLSHPRERVES